MLQFSFFISCRCLRITAPILLAVVVCIIGEYPESRLFAQTASSDEPAARANVAGSLSFTKGRFAVPPSQPQQPLSAIRPGDRGVAEIPRNPRPQHPPTAGRATP